MRAIDADLLKKEMWSDYQINDMFYPNSHEDALKIVSNIIDSLPTVEGKAQKPRVMTLEEAQKWVEIPLESRDPVFYEDRTLERAWWIWNADDRRTYLPAIIGGIGRFWTSRPADEQRKAVKWDD